MKVSWNEFCADCITLPMMTLLYAITRNPDVSLWFALHIAPTKSNRDAVKKLLAERAVQNARAFQWDADGQ